MEDLKENIDCSHSFYAVLSILEEHIIESINHHIISKECISKAPLNAIDDVLTVLCNTVELGYFLDDPNKTPNDKIESHLPDEPVMPAIDRFCKDTVKTKEEIILKTETSDNVNPIEHDLSNHKNTFGLSISSSFKESKISNKSIKNIVQQAEQVKMMKIDDNIQTEFYKDGISGAWHKIKRLKEKENKEIEDALKRKRMRSSYALQKGDFAENQESHVLEEGGFVHTKAQNASKLPKLNQETFVHMAFQYQKSDKSAGDRLSSSSSSDSMEHLFELNAHLEDEQNQLENGEAGSAEKYKIGNYGVSYREKKRLIDQELSKEIDDEIKAKNMTKQEEENKK